MSTSHRAKPELWEATQHAHADVSRLSDAEREQMAQELANPGFIVARRAAQATCPHIVSSDEGTSYCRLAEQTQDKLDRLIAQDRAASAEARPAVGGLVEQVAESIAAAEDEGLTNMTWNHHSRAAIRAVAAWLRTGRREDAAELLEQEAKGDW